MDRQSRWLVLLQHDPDQPALDLIPEVQVRQGGMGTRFDIRGAKQRSILLMIDGVALDAADSAVGVEQPRLATVTNWDEYPGHIDAVQMVEVRPRVSGYIESIHFEDGSEVKAGDLLFVIDPKPYQADFDRVEAQRRQADTRLDLARNDLQRAIRGLPPPSQEKLDAAS